MRRTAIAMSKTLSVRSKLLLLAAAPVLITGTLLLGLFLWGHAATARAYEQALAWENHAEALRKLDWAARFYIDSIADGVEPDPLPHAAESRAKLAQARAEALALAAGFAAKEQAAQQRLDADLDALIVQGDRVGTDRARLHELTARYYNVIDREIRQRVMSEEVGAGIAIRSAQDRSTVLRIGGLAVALVALLIAVGASVLSIRGFGKRVASLQQAAARVAAGDLDRAAPVTSDDELGQLAASLNVMIEALRRQRTRQLGFLAAVAHDLRNPLGAMRFSAQVLLERTDVSAKPDLRKPLAVIDRQSVRLSRLADDLLDAASIEAGELTLHHRLCDLAAVARDVTELYAGTSKRHELRLSVPDEPVEVVCDPARIAQILENLVSNAIKYSPDGGAIDVTLEPSTKEVVVSVADPGVGIERGMFDAIFEPFRRLASTKDVQPGVGLGLSICRRIAAAHGGWIDVASELGRGTKFEVHLPRQPATVG